MSSFRDKYVLSKPVLHRETVNFNLKTVFFFNLKKSYLGPILLHKAPFNNSKRKGSNLCKSYCPLTKGAKITIDGLGQIRNVCIKILLTKSLWEGMEFLC